MGVADWFFGKRDKHKGRSIVADVEFNEDFASIKSRDFFGPFARSPSGRFALAWHDGDGQGRGGHRSSGLGRYLLLDQARIIVEGRIARPNDGKVADNGTFIINDWGFGDGLKGVFSAFSPSGELLLSRTFAANLFNNGLSADGRFAVCQTCNAPGSADSSVLAVFDLAERREISAFTPEAGWAHEYEFDPAAKWIRLRYNDGSFCTYALMGEFLDRDQWIKIKLAAGDLFVADAIMREHEGVLPPQWAEALSSGLDRVLAAPRTDPHAHARAYKIRGQLFEAKGDLTDALASYDAALTLDPKVGVKRKADQLRKRCAVG